MMLLMFRLIEWLERNPAKIKALPAGGCVFPIHSDGHLYATEPYQHFKISSVHIYMGEKGENGDPMPAELAGLLLCMRRNAPNRFSKPLASRA
jgi:hypothetical protein